MSIIIEEKNHSINDGTLKGEGILTLKNINVKLNDLYFLIEVRNSDSAYVRFNVNYSISLMQKKNIDSIITINKDKKNEWQLRFIISRNFHDYSVKIKIPSNWFDIMIYKDGKNVTSHPSTIIKEKFIEILHDLITPNSTWVIKAYNLPLKFYVNSPKKIYEPAQDLRLEVNFSFFNGYYSLYLVDPSKKIIYNESKPLSSEIKIFEYVIRPKAQEGEWNALIYWYNESDAGLAEFSFMVNIPVIIDFLPLTLIISLLFGFSISIYISYKTFSKIKKTQIIKKMMINSKCSNIMNLEYFILSDKESSVALYDKKFSREKLDSSLLAGFLDAVRSFGIELTNSREKSQTIKLEYKDSTIILTEYKKFRLILKMKEMPNDYIYEDIKILMYKLDEEYGKYLLNFNGDIRPFRKVEELLKEYLNTTLLYPLKTNKMHKIKLSGGERSLIKKVHASMKKDKKNYFYTKDLFQEKECNPEDFVMINSLIEKKVFIPSS